MKLLALPTPTVVVTLTFSQPNLAFAGTLHLIRVLLRERYLVHFVASSFTELVPRLAPQPVAALVEAVEQESAENGCPPTPRYHEQYAIVSSKLRDRDPRPQSCADSSPSREAKRQKALPAASLSNGCGAPSSRRLGNREREGLGVPQARE